MHRAGPSLSRRRPRPGTTPGTALVTGASSGIGLAFARRLAALGHPLVLVARDAARLDVLARELAGSRGSPAVEVMAADLVDDADLAGVERRLRAGDVSVLVNSAGIGTNGTLLDVDPADEERMLALNVRAVLRLTAAVLPSLVERGAGEVLNVSSMAGFLPGGGAATYGATKAYVTALSQSLARGYRDRGVRVLAVCPGFTRTEFHARIGAGQPTPSRLLWLTAEQVVDVALRDLAAGRELSIAGAPYKVVHQLSRVLPAPLARRLGAGAAARRGRV